MPLLAFDTSTERLAVGAAGPRGTFAFNGVGGPVASAELLPRIQAALSEVGLGLADVAAIGFGRGPGAFTGLRTSCAVAHGLGLGVGRPLLPLDSLLVVAEDAFGDEPGAAGGAALAEAAAVADPALIAVAMDARMDEVYGALYARAAAGWMTCCEPALYTLAAWGALIEEHAGRLGAIAGSALSAFGARLHCPPGVRRVADERDRAHALLRLAQAAWHAGAAVDAADALPLYLRDKVALTSAERAAASRSSSGAAAPAAAAGQVVAQVRP
ncbi:MAG: tRNA (adenosine(37)-N6)-threonylcarbamoyltransferase complex dimerization subunit type 1 TsaB [Rubrivivax sp.]|nr:tRNA (adenosine(37)-N6)-threonylcarbamoyltransferase complex dimerization subunit type 1 TsaB [Rubrivivax sp.]